MIYTYTIKNITEDNKVITPVISGKIIKVAIQCNKPTNARLKIITNEYEEVINHSLDNKFIILYPYNKVTPFHVDFPRTDYFYSNDMLGVKVTGLQDGEVIDFVKIFYE